MRKQWWGPQRDGRSVTHDRAHSEISTHEQIHDHRSFRFRLQVARRIRRAYRSPQGRRSQRFRIARILVMPSCYSTLRADRVRSMLLTANWRQLDDSATYVQSPILGSCGVANCRTGARNITVSCAVAVRRGADFSHVAVASSPDSSRTLC